MLRYLQTHNYDIFVVYRLIVALIVLGLIATGARSRPRSNKRPARRIRERC